MERDFRKDFRALGWRWAEKRKAALTSIKTQERDALGPRQEAWLLS